MVPVDVQVEPDHRPLGVHARPAADPLAELVADRVLHPPGGVLRVRDRRVADVAIDRQRVVRRQVRRTSRRCGPRRTVRPASGRRLRGPAAARGRRSGARGSPGRAGPGRRRTRRRRGRGRRRRPRARPVRGPGSAPGRGRRWRSTGSVISPGPARTQRRRRRPTTATSMASLSQLLDEPDLDAPCRTGCRISRRGWPTQITRSTGSARKNCDDARLPERVARPACTTSIRRPPPMTPSDDGRHDEQDEARCPTAATTAGLRQPCTARTTMRKIATSNARNRNRTNPRQQSEPRDWPPFTSEPHRR